MIKITKNKVGNHVQVDIHDYLLFNTIIYKIR